MSYSLKYYPDPGIAFDISKMLFVKLNPESVWKEYLTSIDSCNDETNYINNTTTILPEPDSALLLFAFIPPNKTETFISKTIDSLVSISFTEFSINNLITYFNNLSQLQNDLYRYYFGNQDYSFVNLDKIIRTSRFIPDKIKLLLFSFIINPQRYVLSLITTIQEYYSLIKNKHIPLASQVVITSSFINGLLVDTCSSNNISTINSVPETIAYSLCFVTKDYLFCDFNIAHPYFITTPFTIDNLYTSNDFFSSNTFLTCTTALSDKFRISIINLLISKKEMSLQEISHSINLSSSATYHHIELLKKAKMISSIHHGRTVYYSYNPIGFQDTIKSLHKIMKGEFSL